MARTIKEIEQEIRALTRDEQEQLLRALVDELDGPVDPGVEEAWAAEVRRRSRELDDGKVTPIPADEVFASIRTELRR